MAFPHLFTFLSSFSIIIGDILQRTAAAEIDQLVTDGEQFVKRIVHGEKISDIPGYLLFTAPYKLCEGDCVGGESNFALSFPIYVGKKGKETYKDMYQRDYHKIHPKNPNAPFKKAPTKKLFTLCPSEITEELTVTTTEASTVSETDTVVTESPTITPTTETQTITETTIIPTTETPTVTETPTEFHTTETPTVIPTTENPTVTETPTEALTVTETSTETPTVTEIPTTETPTEAPTEIHTTEALTIIAPLTTNTKTTINTSKMPKTEVNAETTEMYETKIPQYTETVVTETEDITFEAYTDTTGAITEENEDTTYITNANGISLILILAALQPGLGSLPWNSWSWSAPQEPITYFFRRHQNMPVKSPGHECQCPPSKECVMDFKINEDAIEFLNMQGVLKDEEVQEIKEDIEKSNPVQAIRRIRRNKNDVGIDGEEECCCPPRNVMVPTFITAGKFKETLNNLMVNKTVHT